MIVHLDAYRQKIAAIKSFISRDPPRVVETFDTWEPGDQMFFAICASEATAIALAYMQFDQRVPTLYASECDVKNAHKAQPDLLTLRYHAWRVILKETEPRTWCVGSVRRLT